MYVELNVEWDRSRWFHHGQPSELNCFRKNSQIELNDSVSRADLNLEQSLMRFSLVFQLNQEFWAIRL